MRPTSHKPAMTAVNLDQPDGISNAVILEIISALRSIRYGSIEVVIHNSKIVQIERKEKFRIGQETSNAGR